MAPAASPKRDEQAAATVDGSELFRALLDKPIKSEPATSDMSRLLEMPPLGTQPVAAVPTRRARDVFDPGDFVQWESMQLDSRQLDQRRYLEMREMENREMRRRREEMERIEYERYQLGPRSRRVCPICGDPRCGGSDRF